MKKSEEVTLGKGVVVIAAMSLAVGVQFLAEKFDVSFILRVTAWMLIGLAAMTCWHYRAIRRRPVLFWGFVGVVVVGGVLVLLASIIPEGSAP